MSVFVRLAALVTRKVFSDSFYSQLRQFYYSLRKNRVTKSVSAEGFLEWYATHIDKNVPLLATRITPELMKTGETDLALLRKHGLKKGSTLFEHGVGYFRASSCFVNFLNKDKFVGNDISAQRINLGIKNHPELMKKGPKFYVSKDNKFSFPEKRRFDFLYSSAVLCHMPPEDILAMFKYMKKNLMHEKSKFIFNYSCLDFDHFLFIDEWGREEVLRRFKEGTMSASAGLVFKLMEEYQGRDMLTISKTQFYHSRNYMEQLVKQSGLRFEDITEPHHDESNSCYLNTRIIKAYL